MRSAVLIVDACTGINVLATRRWTQVFSAGDWRPVMPRQAAAETLFVYDDDGERDRVDLRAMADAGLLEIWDPVDDEVSEMLRHAVRLGAGEAASLAIARSRDLPLATDDRPACAAAAEDPMVRVVSTAELLHRWAQGRPPDEVRGAVVAITGRAAFRPRSSDPLAEWWDDVLSDA